MLFSFVVPIYNVEPFLDRCVASLRGQTYSDIEILLVDDESPDNCPQMCDAYAVEDERIKVIHKKNGGLSDARNFGLLAATGEYVFFVDSDDYVETNTCEKFLKYAQTGSDILIGDAIVEGGKCDLQHIAPQNAVYGGTEYLKNAASEQKRPMAAWLNVYRRQFLLENDLYFQYGILHEDEQFTPRVFLKAKSVINTGICFYHYLIREGSISTKKDKRRNAKDLFETCCQLEAIYGELEDTELRRLMQDTLSEKYLNMAQIGGLYRYPEFAHTDFVKRNANLPRTKLKAALYCFSPTIYYYINLITKSILKSER